MSEPDAPAGELLTDEERWQRYLAAIAGDELRHMAVLVTLHDDGSQTHSTWVPSIEEYATIRRYLDREPQRSFLVNPQIARDALLNTEGTPGVMYL